MNIDFGQIRHSECGEIFFVGDCIPESHSLSDLISSSLCNRIRKSELAVANLEASIKTGDPIPKVGPTKSTSNEGIRLLKNIGFNVVTLANNHTTDYGGTGLNKLRKECDEVGIKTVGTGMNQRCALEPIYKQVNGNSIALFNACTKEFGIAAPDRPGTAWVGDQRLPKKIKKANEKADVIFLVAHGGIEFVPIPPILWQEQLRELASLGIDAIISHHPHVAQGWEVYEDVPIFYSLGNFLFHMQTRPSTRWGYGVEIHLEDGNINRCKINLIKEYDSTINIIKSSKDKEKKRKYLQKTSDVISSSPARKGHWQEICAQIYGQRYRSSLEDYGNDHITALIKTPIREIDRLTEGIFTQTELIKEQERILYHYIQNRSHRDVIQTALGLKSGTISDRRTPEIQSDARDLLANTDDRFQESPIKTHIRNIKIAINRLNLI